jgi:restriction endonuclease Mrr
VNGICPSCGHQEPITLEIHDVIHISNSSEIKLIPKTSFDLDIIHDGRTIIEVSKAVDDRILEHFRKNPDELRTMDHRLFEKLVAEIYHGFGYEVELTQQTRDGGKDIIAIKRGAEAKVKYLIECKRPDPGGYVSVGTVRELYGVKAHEKATKGIIVTTAYFSPDAKTLLNEHEWELEGKEYDDLRIWLEQYSSLRKGK